MRARMKQTDRVHNLEDFPFVQENQAHDRTQEFHTSVEHLVDPSS